MKKQLQYGLFVLALLLGVVSTCMYIPTRISYAHHADSEVDIQNDIQTGNATFSQITMPSLALGSEQIRTTNFGSASVGRIIPDNYSFQLSHSNQLFALQFFSAKSFYGSYFAQIQHQGFYLYYLRKLLI